MAKKLVDLTAGGSSGTKNDRLYTDAVTGRGVGISKTDYSRPRSGAPSLAELWQQQSDIKAANDAAKADAMQMINYMLTPQGMIDDLRGQTPEDILNGLKPFKNNESKTAETPTQTPNDILDAAKGGLVAGILDGAGLGPTPSGGGNGGGNKVTYIDAAGNAQKGTTAETPPETPAEPQRTYLDDMRDQYQKLYDEAVKANDAAARAAAERARAQVNEGIGSLGDSYGNLNKQLYRDYMESLRVLPQEMAARGYNGGMSESARLGLDTAYGERLNENEAARIAAEAELRQQAADAEYQANAARDQANAEAQQNLYANFMNLMIQQQNEAAQKAQNMAQYGDFSGYLDLGYTQSQTDQMQKAWIAANPEMAQALGYVKAPEPVYSPYGDGGGGTLDKLKADDKKVKVNGKEYTVNSYGETRFGENMTRGEIQRAAQQDYHDGKISYAEYRQILKTLH